MIPVDFGVAQPKELNKRVDAYAVIGADGTVTTVGHRYKRILRR